MAVELFNPDLCNGCGTCVTTCPCDVFRLDTPNKKTVVAYPQECQVCSMCIIYCKTGAIRVTPDKYVPPMTAYR